MDSTFRTTNLNKAFTEIINRVMSMQGIIPKSLGAALGYSERQSLAMLRGHRAMSLWEIQQISQYLGLTWQISATVTDKD